MDEKLEKMTKRLELLEKEIETNSKNEKDVDEEEYDTCGYCRRKTLKRHLRCDEAYDYLCYTCEDGLRYGFEGLDNRKCGICHKRFVDLYTDEFGDTICYDCRN
jgi:hypothetical protein